MYSSDVQRIAGFESRFAKAQASTVVDLPFGYAVLQEDFPLSHNHNRVIVLSSASPADVVAAVEDVLGAAGVGHRYVTVDDQALGGIGLVLTGEGYEQETISTMIYRGPKVYSVPDESGPVARAAESPGATSVAAVSFENVRPAIIRDWLVTIPDATEEELRQLADRTTLYERGADLLRLVVHHGEQIAARGDLYLDRQDEVAQFESLVTHADFQGLGYGGALVNEALRLAQAAGKDLFFLSADLNDWPIEWYRRLGFVDVAKSREFTRQNVSD